jgi:hypothetical protein
MILWFYDSMILWFYDSMILWFYDSMILWFYDSMILWFYDSMILWIYNTYMILMCLFLLMYLSFLSFRLLRMRYVMLWCLSNAAGVDEILLSFIKSLCLYCWVRFQSHLYLFGISGKVEGLCGAANSRGCCPREIVGL